MTDEERQNEQEFWDKVKFGPKRLAIDMLTRHNQAQDRIIQKLYERVGKLEEAVLQGRPK